MAPAEDQQRIRKHQRVRKDGVEAMVRSLDFLAKLTGVFGEFSLWRGGVVGEGEGKHSMMLIFKILSCLDRNLQIDSTKHIWKCKIPDIVKAVLKKDVFGGLSLLDFKTYYKATQVWHKDRQIDDWDIMESSEINPYIYDQLIF